MNRPETCEQNSKHFPNDSQWVKHNLRMAAYYNSVPAVTSEKCWDSRDDRHVDCLEGKL